MCLSNMAIHRQATGRHTEAEALFQNALSLLQKALGSGHHLTAYTKSNYADFLLLTGRCAEALPLAKEALENLRHALPRGHHYIKWGREVLKRARVVKPDPPKRPKWRKA
jgi:tetratricopeptide (TPR) repeat protein